MCILSSRQKIEKKNLEECKMSDRDRIENELKMNEFKTNLKRIQSFCDLMPFVIRYDAKEKREIKVQKEYGKKSCDLKKRKKRSVKMCNRGQNLKSLFAQPKVCTRCIILWQYYYESRALHYSCDKRQHLGLARVAKVPNQIKMYLISMVYENLALKSLLVLNQALPNDFQCLNTEQ